MTSIINFSFHHLRSRSESRGWRLTRRQLKSRAAAMVAAGYKLPAPAAEFVWESWGLAGRARRAGLVLSTAA